MVTKANDPVLDLLSEPIDGINMEATGSGINMNGAPISNLPAPSFASDAARLSDIQGFSSSFPPGLGPLPWAGSEGTIPPGWLICDGSIYNISTFPALFAAIGAVYGGDGIVTFAVPDCRGRVMVGKDDMGGAGAGRVSGGSVLGATGGAQSHTLSVGEMPIHTHTGNSGSAGGHTHTGSTNTTGSHIHSGGGNSGCAQGSGDNNLMSCGRQNTGSAGNHSHTLTINSVSDHSHSLTIDNEGGDGAHNNLQPYIIVNYIIKST